jgi:hypothetical protein
LQRFRLSSSLLNWGPGLLSSGQSVPAMTLSFREILETLNRRQVDFIVVGGVAAVNRGAPITTFDLYVLVRVDSANAARLLLALSELHARFREH